MAGEDARRVDRRPARVAGDAVLVPDPPTVRPGVGEDAGVRLELADEGDRRRPVVVGAVVDLPRRPHAAVVAVAAVGPVEPDLGDRAVVRQQFGELVAVVGQVGGRAVVGRGPVPRREVDAEAHALSVAGVADLADDVAGAVLPRAGLDAAVGVLARPEAEPVVVLARQHDAGQAAGLGGGDDLVGRKIGRRERGRRLVAVPPLLVGERVDREVDEGVRPAVVPGQLAGRRRRPVRGRRRVGCGGDGHDGHRSGGGGGQFARWTGHEAIPLRTWSRSRLLAVTYFVLGQPGSALR